MSRGGPPPSTSVPRVPIGSRRGTDGVVVGRCGPQARAVKTVELATPLGVFLLESTQRLSQETPLASQPAQLGYLSGEVDERASGDALPLVIRNGDRRHEPGRHPLVERRGRDGEQTREAGEALDAEEAIELANSELHAIRRQRRAAERP
jgi:hypothetical protein